MILEKSVSVVIPVYNGEEVVRSAINSALCQEQVGEVICVNDGSTDDTGLVLESIIDPRLKVITIQNSGASHARNIGAEAASLKFIAFLDADDCFLQNRFDSQLMAMIKYNKKISICSILVMGMDNSFKFNFSKSKFSKYNQKLKMNAIFGQLLTMNTPTIIVEKEFFLSLNGFDTELSLREDHKFLIEALRVEDVFIEGTSPVVRRQYEKSSTSSVTLQKLISGNKKFHNRLKSANYFQILISNVSLFHVCFRRFGFFNSIKANPIFLVYFLFYPVYLLVRLYYK